MLNHNEGERTCDNELIEVTSWHFTPHYLGDKAVAVEIWEWERESSSTRTSVTRQTDTFAPATLNKSDIKAQVHLNVSEGELTAC